MTSFEGLWCFQSGSADQPTPFTFGGVVVLVGGSLLGGDSTFAYIGDYEVRNAHLRARVCSRQWRRAIADANFVLAGEGQGGGYQVILDGTRDGDFISGHISPEEQPDFRLPIRMRWIQALSDKGH